MTDIFSHSPVLAVAFVVIVGAMVVPAPTRWPAWLAVSTPEVSSLKVFGWAACLIAIGVPLFLVSGWGYIAYLALALVCSVLLSRKPAEPRFSQRHAKINQTALLAAIAAQTGR
jgi:hypothetical protein